MPHIVTENCIKCKYTDCVEICPVDCFYEAEHMLVIHPDECIDCALCIPECPVDAIVPDDELPADQIIFIDINKDLALQSPNITLKKDPPEQADEWRDKPDKRRFLPPTS